MAQTTGGTTAKGLVTGYSTNGSDFTDVSGFGVAVEPSGAERAFSEQHTFEGDTPIVGTGKLSAADVTVRAVYTQVDSEFFDVMYDAKVNDSDIWIKYSTFGGTSGDKEYVIKGKCVMCTPPAGDAGSADTVLFEARVVGAQYTEQAVA